MRAVAPSEVRPYVRTGGRLAAPGVALDTLLVADTAIGALPHTGQAAEVLRVLGNSYLTVAELAGHLDVPLGTAQVLTLDLVNAGAIRLLGPTPLTPAPTDDVAAQLSLLASVLDGIHDL